MCGIVGAWKRHGATAPYFAVHEALKELSHRGPNDNGLECIGGPEGDLILGHTRLSIIDLTPAGHQPMHSHCKRYVLVFNGEIYNYRELRAELRQRGHQFISNSDTEVLLVSWTEWGPACIPRFRGMFAFTLLDREMQTLWCVRDAFGIKPFFFRLDAEHFSFASEIPALLKSSGERVRLDMNSAYLYLVHGVYDKGSATFYEDVKQLAPGHLLKLPLSGPVLQGSLSRWWQPDIVECNELSFDEAAQQLRARFLDSVNMHLRSDVPLGAALSGGIDSSALVCAIRHLEPDIPIHTFSFIAQGDLASEEHWVDLVNARAGAHGHKVVVHPIELASDLDDMMRSQGEPFGSTSIYAQYRVFKLAKRNGITVMLDGQGADELLAGYKGYPEARMRSLWEERRFKELLCFSEHWPRWPGRTKKHALLALLSLGVPSSLRTLAFRLIGRSPDPSWLASDVFADAGVAIRPELSSLSPMAPGRRLAERLYQELSGGQLSSLLRHGDRNSMRWSIEGRVPFLTTDLAEFTLKLPESYLVSPTGETKSVFRAAMRGIVPDEILDRRDKIGFQTPEHVWLNALGPQVFGWLDGLESLPIVNAAECRREVASILDGSKPFSFQVWRLINFARWSQLSGIAT